MPTGDMMSVMIKNLRSEVGYSLSTAQGVNNVDTLKYLLQRTQLELWQAFQWPELTVRIDIALSAGQYLYDFNPTISGMDYDQVRSAWSSRPNDDSWYALGYGIDEDKVAPGGGNSWRADPVQIWDVENNTSGTPLARFRVWPTPDTNGGYVRFKGNRHLGLFVNDSDTSTLDSTLIVLFAAAEVLTRAKAEDAASKMQKAQRHLQKILGNKISAKMRVSTLGGGSPAYKNIYQDNLSYSSTHWNQ